MLNYQDRFSPHKLKLFIGCSRVLIGLGISSILFVCIVSNLVLFCIEFYVMCDLVYEHTYNIFHFLVLFCCIFAQKNWKKMLNKLMIVSFLMMGCLQFYSVTANTSISVQNNYKKEVNVKIAGAGVGGCDILLQPGESNQYDCWCLWGTVNYGFCSYEQGKVSTYSTEAVISPDNTTDSKNLSTGKCKVVTGESLLCSDVSSLGNCYDGAYSCVIDESGFCHCETV